MIISYVYRNKSRIENINGNMHLNFYEPELYSLNSILIPPGTNMQTDAKINQNLTIYCNDKDKKECFFHLEIHKTETSDKKPVYFIDTHFVIKKKEMDNLIKYINHNKQDEDGISCAIGFKEIANENKVNDIANDISKRLSYETFSFYKIFNSKDLKYEITFKIDRFNYTIKS
jgi:hypothetical protein